MASMLAYLIPFTPYPYRGEPVSCDLCSSTQTELICEYDRRFKRLRTVACLRCGLIRTDPMPTVAEVEEYYRNAYRLDYQLARQGPSRRHLVRTRREAERRLALLAPALRPGASILDFGSGAGVFLGVAARAGYTVLGIEPGRDYADYARRTFGVDVQGDIWEHVDRPLGPFDLITAVEVLEHLRKPVEALRWLTAHLADDGIIQVTVPNGLPNGEEAFRRFHFAHLHNFTPTTLRWAAQARGLEIESRFAPVGTSMVFRKAPDGAAPPVFDRNHGEGLSRFYPKDSIGRHVLSGRWLSGRVDQLRKTVHDTFDS